MDAGAFGLQEIDDPVPPAGGLDDYRLRWRGGSARPGDETADDRAGDDAGVGDSVDAVKTGQRDGVTAMATLLYAVVVTGVNARTRK
jgi:hypothetical protein